MGIVYLIIKGQVINFPIFEYIDVDVLLIIISYFVLTGSYRAAFIYSWIFGSFMDALCSGPYGIFTLLYVMLFFSLRITLVYFQTEHKIGQFFFLFSASIIKYLFLLMLFNLFTFHGNIFISRAISMFSSTLATAMIAPFFIDFLHAFAAKLSRDIR